MKQQLFFLSFPIFSASCTVENKLHDISPPIPAGECDVSNPVDGSEAFQPIAVCSASNTVVPPIRESLDVLGDESYDPNGYEIIDYQWRLQQRPSGSTAPFGEGEVNQYGFTPDIVGTYVMELVVTNELCIQSEPCQVEVQAVPDGDIWVEMHWETANDDMDLHLVRDNASYESEGDCYYGNCVSDSGMSLDWGTNSVDDDPRLDLDDISGVGPENINIGAPSSGTYQVVVHDYPGSEMHSSNLVTVRIYLGGELKYEESKGFLSLVQLPSLGWHTSPRTRVPPAYPKIVQLRSRPATKGHRPRHPITPSALQPSSSSPGASSPPRGSKKGSPQARATRSRGA